MKKTLSTILVITAIFLMSSCTSNKMKEPDTTEGSKATVEFLKEKIGGDKSITMISMGGSKDLSTDMGIVVVDEASDKDTYTEYTYNSMDMKTDGFKTEEENNNDKENKGIKISEISASNFVENIEKMKALIPAEFEYTSCNDYTQVFRNGKTHSVYAVLHALSKEGSNTSLKGRRIETTYYEFKFDIDENGKTTLREE